MQQHSQDSSATVIDNLMQSAGQPDNRPFRERARMVGAVYTISYTEAIWLRSSKLILTTLMTS